MASKFKEECPEYKKFQWKVWGQFSQLTLAQALLSHSDDAWIHKHRLLLRSELDVDADTRDECILQMKHKLRNIVIEEKKEEREWSNYWNETL